MAALHNAITELSTRIILPLVALVDWKFQIVLANVSHPLLVQRLKHIAQPLSNIFMPRSWFVANMELIRAEQENHKHWAASTISNVMWKMLNCCFTALGANFFFLMCFLLNCTKISLFQIGDRIVSICGTSAEGMSHSQAVTLLKNATGTIQLQVTNRTDVHIKTLVSPFPFSLDKTCRRCYIISRWSWTVFFTLSVSKVFIWKEQLKATSGRLWNTIKLVSPIQHYHHAMHEPLSCQ